MTVWLLASDSDIYVEDVWLPLAAAAGIAVGLWLLLLLVFAVVTRPREVEPAEPTMELGEETPAVVDYLLSGYHVTNHGVAGTLLDLAAEHYLDIDERPDGTYFKTGREPPDRLLPHERMLYDHVAHLAQGGAVPAQALTTGTTGHAAAWLKRFDGLVMQNARSLGLIEPRLGFKEWGIVRLAGLAAAALVIAAATQANAIQLGILVCAVALAVSHTALEKLFGTQKLTLRGEHAVAHWLGVKEYLSRGEGFHDLPAAHVILWDRYMACAAAMGLARTAARSLPLGAEDDHKAWSNYTGAWRQVTVRYPRRRLVWGRGPLNVLFIGLLTIAIGAGGIYLSIQFLDTVSSFHAGRDTDHWLSQGGLIAIGVFGLVCFWGLTTVNLAFIDFGARRALQGLVVRRRAYSAGNDKTDYFVAVDDGTSAEIKAWCVNRAMYHAVGERSVVDALVTRAQAHVYRMAVIRPGSEPALPEEPGAPSVHPAAAMPRWLDGLIASAVTGAYAADPATVLTAGEIAGVVGEQVSPESAPAALASGPMRSARYRTASGAHIDVRIAGGAFSQMFKSVASRWPQRDQVGGLEMLIRHDTLLLLGASEAVMIQIEGGKVGDRDAALHQLAVIAAGRLQPASAPSTQPVS